jgi:hypothetical protein
MNLKFNFIKDCVKLFLFNDKSFKNIQKENIITPILWLAIPISILITVIFSVIGFYSSPMDGLIGLFTGLLISIFILFIGAIYMIIFYGITHLILVGFGSEIKFKENFKLQLSTYSFGLTIWTLPIFILGFLIFTIFPFENFTAVSGTLLIFLFLALLGIYIWYLLVLVHYLSKLNKISKLKTFFAITIVLIISLSLSSLLEFMSS